MELEVVERTCELRKDLVYKEMEDIHINSADRVAIHSRR